MQLIQLRKNASKQGKRIEVHKRLLLPFAAAICAAALLSQLCACSKGPHEGASAGVSKLSSSVQASGVSAGSSDPSAASSTPASSTADSTAPAAPNPPTADLSAAAMVGNSYVTDLENSGLVPKMDFYDRVGLTVKTVFTLSSGGSGTPIMDTLNQKQYHKVLLLFGENELGWESTQAFYNAYAKVIDAVKARQPGAEIYIQSIFPVSAAVSLKNEENTNNDRIREYNGILKRLAQAEGAVYLDVYSVLADSSGALPDGAATDGIHPSRRYCQIWADYLKSHC